jgi:hypothetical protein
MSLERRADIIETNCPSCDTCWNAFCVLSYLSRQSLYLYWIADEVVKKNIKPLQRRALLERAMRLKRKSGLVPAISFKIGVIPLTFPR